jgi:hypothetical protein
LVLGALKDLLGHFMTVKCTDKRLGVLPDGRASRAGIRPVTEKTHMKGGLV